MVRQREMNVTAPYSWARMDLLGAPGVEARDK